MATCKWPGCEAQVNQRTFCDKHYVGMQVAYTFVLGICEDMSLGREEAKRWALVFGPHIVKIDGSTSWVIIDEVTNQFAVKVFLSQKTPRRVAYERAARLRNERGFISTRTLIHAVIADTEWLSVAEAARHIGVSHRYLRHLVNEDRNPIVTRHASTNPLRSGLLGFTRPVLEDLRASVRRVDNRRKC